MISIIDYGIGNLRSVEKAFHSLGQAAEITGDARAISRAEAVVLPGVGAFRDAMAYLTETGLVETINGVIDAGTPFLGICLGMQAFAEVSEEGGENPGLGIIRGRVVKLPETVKVPQMGWNEVKMKPGVGIFEGIPEGVRFYFAHSYYLAPVSTDVVAGTTDYGVEFASAVARENVFGTQFHPEKSGRWGLQVLKNFAELK